MIINEDKRNSVLMDLTTIFIGTSIIKKTNFVL